VRLLLCSLFWASNHHILSLRSIFKTQKRKGGAIRENFLVAAAQNEKGTSSATRRSQKTAEKKKI
jgi:hypothetical protein